MDSGRLGLDRLVLVAHNLGRDVGGLVLLRQPQRSLIRHAVHSSGRYKACYVEGWRADGG